jgi:PA14 domain
MKIKSLSKYTLWAYFAFWIIYFAFFWWNAVNVDDRGNLVVGNVNIWGDWAAHFTMGSSMAYREFFLFESPFVIGAPFRYPFLTNMISALLIRCHIAFFAAFTLPSFFLSLFIVVMLFVFYKTLFKSKAVAILSSCIFLFNGGLGFLYLIKTALKSSSPLNTLLFPPQLTTNMASLSIKWISVIDSMIIPQRAFTLGFPLSLLAITLIYKHMKDDYELRGTTVQNKVILTAGILLGFLPLIHTHTLLSLFVILGFWFWGDAKTHPENFIQTRLYKWGLLLGVTLVFALPLLYIFLLNGAGVNGMKWYPGWYAKEDHVNWFLLWIRNWGITPVMAVAGFVLFYKAQKLKIEKYRLWFIFGPFFVLFMLMNLFLFQAWVWDNTKVLVWASVGFSGLAGYAVFALLKKDRYWKIISILFFILMTLSGTIDAYRTIVPSLNRFQMYSQEDLYLADWTMENTDPHSIWLTGSFHNHWLFNLTGRQTLMTYEGWLWTHGYDYLKVKDAVKEMYQDPSKTYLFQNYNVSYIVIGPEERKEWNIDTKKFDERLRLVKRTDNYSIYSATLPAVGPKELEIANSMIIPNLDKTIEPSEEFKTGFVKTIYTGKYFFGKPHSIEKGATDFDFWLDSDKAKPFPVPCSITWEGYLKAPYDGTYLFSLSSDDGSWLEIDDVKVVDNGGDHMVNKVTRAVRLSKGFHKMKLSYFENGGGAILKLTWAPPQQAENPLQSTSVFYK